MYYKIHLGYIKNATLLYHKFDSYLACRQTYDQH